MIYPSLRLSLLVSLSQLEASILSTRRCLSPIADACLVNLSIIPITSALSLPSPTFPFIGNVIFLRPSKVANDIVEAFVEKLSVIFMSISLP